MISNYEEVLKKTEKLDSERILLRRFKKTDIDDIYKFGSDDKTVKFLVWEGVKSKEEAKESYDNYYSVEPGVFAIELKSERKCIGNIALRLIHEHDKASFGYVLIRNYWNQGYMTEALSTIIRFAFITLDINRIEAIHYIGNEASGKVMQKCGMKHEGTALKEFKIKGVFRDAEHYAILSNDFKTDLLNSPQYSERI